MCDNYMIVSWEDVHNELDILTKILMAFRQPVYYIHHLEVKYNSLNTFKIYFETRWHPDDTLHAEIWDIISKMDNIRMQVFSYEMGCEVIEKYANGKIHTWTHANVPDGFLQHFGEDIVIENFARNIDRINDISTKQAVQFINNRTDDTDWEKVHGMLIAYFDWDIDIDSTNHPVTKALFKRQKKNTKNFLRVWIEKLKNYISDLYA